ncbi:Dedicator of cytokinesis protein 3 [Leucoagaricus sp. SymC.cos]|nr:Dedicator of cytokinesis protein 3 [Leucoagaricus sp. SymC.cos]
MWEPLPLIVYGYAIHPLTPYKREARQSLRNRLSTVTEASADDHSIMLRDVVSLEVGDEVYAFEKYTPSAKDFVEGPWYRGYVVCTARRPPISWSESSTARPAKLEEPQQVFIGIFPASHIFVRDELPDAEGRLLELAHSLGGGAADGEYLASGAWTRDKAMGVLQEVDEQPASRAPIRSASVRSVSIRSSSPPLSHIDRPLPPRPSLKSGDDTASGVEQPIIDEIASALREWHTLMFHYLARRDYKLFQVVREHIEALHSGRRQLLAQTLNAEETDYMLRECVIRLVSGNLVQGLDVIVRHPTWGGLVNVDIDTVPVPRSWISAVRMYAMQTSLAYINVRDDVEIKPYRISTDQLLTNTLPTPANSAFPELPHLHQRTRSQSSAGLIRSSTRHSTAKFFHVFLDLRAFVASPCAPGETAELFFSLYKKQGTQFVTEEFCAILNHNGVLARDPSTKIRTLFTDLAYADIQDPIYLVCRIVRSGSFKIGSGFSENGKRGSEVSYRNEQAWDSKQSPGANGTRNLSNGDSTSFVRRPFGCAVLELTQLSKMAADQSDFTGLKEYTMPIYVPTNEASFSMIHQSIINNIAKEYDKSPRHVSSVILAEMLAVSIKIFRGDAPAVVRENPSLLHDIPHTLRLGFPDVVFPGDKRNELYIKLWCGDFGASNNTSGRLSLGRPPNGNVQITTEIKDQNGRMVENVISQGSGEPLMSQFHSMVFHRTVEPTFGELIKIKLPPNEVPNWHLFFTFRNRSGREKAGGKSGTDTLDRPFAFAFQPLFPDSSAFVEDGSHTLVMYRADRISQLTPDIYLPSPSTLSAGQKADQLAIPPELQKLAPPLKDTLTIRTSLCSTTLTQNPTLFQLLGWESISDKDTLSHLLTRFTFVGEGEIVKFLRDIFEALFGILVSQNNQSGEMDLLVFNALVTVLGIVQDRRFSNFQPVLEVYIEKHFTCAGATSHIIHSMNRLLINPTSEETAHHLRAALKVWHYIFKFIARSRELQKAKEIGMGGGAIAEHFEATFKRELRAHISEVTRMMSISSPAIVGTQTIALQHFTSILPELEKIFTNVELVSIATTFANAVTANKGKIVIWKLIMYLHMVKGFLFDHTQSRPLLVEAVVIWIKPHFGRYDEYLHTSTHDSDAVRDAARLTWLESIRLCITIIAVMLDKLQQNLVKPEIRVDNRKYRQEQENVDCLLSLLPRLLDSYRELQSPASRKVMEQTRSQPNYRSSIPVTFPESYPFSLLASLPETPRSVGVTAAVPKDADNLFSPALGETAVVILVLILALPVKEILNFMENSLVIEGRDRFISLLSQLFKVATSILDNEVFPRTWLNINILAHKVLIKMMEPVATILEKEFIPPQEQESDFDSNVWRECFYMLLRLLSSDQLVIEEFSPQKRRAVWRLAGDIRGDGAAILLNLWQALGTSVLGGGTELPIRYGGYQVYLHSLVGHVVNLCLSHHDQLRNNAVQMLFSMIVTEYHQSEHFDGIENELVTRLDSLFMSDSKGDDISRAFFISQLRLLFTTSDVDEQLRERVSNFLDSVDLFLELLLSVRDLPEGEEFQDDRVMATVRLALVKQDEIYIKYVHQLVNMHLQSQNYVEAALTLKLHSDLHEWDLNSFIGPMEDLGLPQQSHFHRKETLCLLILNYLGQGKAWETAIEICKELAFQHAGVTFNYSRLSEILRHQATLLEHIVAEQRYYPDYYRVTFYGNFPAAIRDKRFIYRGYEWEKFGAFCERMLNKHPGAQLLKTPGDPPVDIRFGNDQYIQCTAVTPEPDRTSPIFTNPDVPLAVRTHYEHSAINLFSSSRQVKKTARDGSEEIWHEKTYFTTEETFPTVLRRSEVVAVEIVEISPLENALNEVELKTKELSSLYQKYQALAKTAQHVSTNALAMALNSAVDAPLNTGISSYRQTFFNPDYVARNPERVELLEKLRIAIDEQVRVIDSCLKLHGHLCPPEFIPFHETLEKFFKRNFKEEIKRLAVEVSDSISPMPNSKQQTPLQRHLAHLARHGITGVASAPGDMVGSDSMSVDSPRNSFINVGNGNNAIQSTSAPQVSGASVAPSFMGSVGSFSLRTRLSRFGSITFGWPGRNATNT